MPAASAALTAIAAVFGATFLTWRGVVAHWSARAAQAQTHIARDGHYAAIFSKAVDQLGATRDVVRTVEQQTVHNTEPNLEVRLGAIYALERVARDSERDHWPIMEVLCAYIRNPQNCGQPSIFDKTHGSEAESEWHDTLPALRVDVQAALLVIGRRSQRQREVEMENGWVLDLSGANLQRARIEGGHFSRAQFSGAFLDRAFLVDASLENADFSHCSLVEVTFQNARLRSANFNETAVRFLRVGGSDLRRAWFGNTELAWSRFDESDLTCASFEWAELANTTFEKSNLSGASFCLAKFQNVQFTKGCQFESTLFVRTDLTQTFGLSQGTIDQTVGDGSTVLSRGWARPTDWYRDNLDLMACAKLYTGNIERFGLQD